MIKHEDCRYASKATTNKHCSHPDRRCHYSCWDEVFPDHAGKCPLAEPREKKPTCGNCRWPDHFCLIDTHTMMALTDSYLICPQFSRPGVINFQHVKVDPTWPGCLMWQAKEEKK